jgi:hypothetical protein
MPDKVTTSLKFLTAFICALCALPVFADLALDPAVIEIHDVTQAGKVMVLNDGEPVPAGEIRRVTAGVFKTGNAVPKHKAGGTHFSNYSYMFSFDVKSDGAIVITPVASTLQVGKYDLFVYTPHGVAKGVIDAHLRSTVPPRPRVAGESFRSFIGLELPDHFYGQAVAINLAADEKNFYTWYVDGEVEAAGQGMTSFRTRPEIGEHEITFDVRNPGGVITSEGGGKVSIVAEEAVRKTIRKGKTLRFAVPAGYSSATWAMNGKPITSRKARSGESTLKEIRFGNKGTHTVTCLLQNPDNGNFRMLTWLIDVK